MKNNVIMLMLLGCLVSPIVVSETAAANPCNNTPPILKHGDIEAEASLLDDRLRHPLKVIDENGVERYETCGGVGTLELNKSYSDKLWKEKGIAPGFSVNVPDNSTHFIHDIKISILGGEAIAEPILTIQLGGANSSLRIENVELSGVVQGLSIAGSGKAVLSNVVINGRNTGECLIIKSPGAEISGLTVKSCSIGVLVGAPNVRIASSEIAGNLLGIIAQNVAGTKLEDTLIYDNDDGEPTSEVMGEDALQISFSPGPMFYNVIKDTVDIVEHGIDPIVFAEKAVVMLPVRIEEKKPSLIQLFTSRAGKCTSKTLPTGQACDFVRNDKNEPLKINVLASEIEGKSLELAVPPAYRMEQLVMLYTDPIDGTSNFSRPFIVGQGGVVAFVSSPFDMTTSGGSNMEGIDVANVDVQGVDVGAGGGSTGVAGATAASGGCGKAELVPGGSARTVDVAMALWWILFSAAIVTTARTVKARSKNR